MIVKILIEWYISVMICMLGMSKFIDKKGMQWAPCNKCKFKVSFGIYRSAGFCKVLGTEIEVFDGTCMLLK